MTTAGNADSEMQVGRCYTKARRHPVMVGKWPGGGRIWGGPYTVPQVIVLVTSFLLLILTRPLWAHFGWVDVLIALGVPFGLSLLVRHVHIDGRNPLAVAASAFGMLATPRGGRMGGRPLSSPGRRQLIGACTLTWSPPPVSPVMAPRTRDRLAVTHPVSAAAVPAATAGDGLVDRPPRVLSGVGALLAARSADDDQGPLSGSSTDEGVL
ncbi:hypothetical protein ABZY02_35370 [Streptomyces sp. NPDC006649]|uniref:hypothetical protein n=1 Tax=Streptomyces sp. NPDC006649 TaxID=3156896 RepID=UPI0033A382AA